MLTTTTRAAGGEVGLLEGWTLAKVVNETIAADADQPVKRPIVAVIDVLPPMAAAKKLSAFTVRWPGRLALMPKPVWPATR